MFYILLVLMLTDILSSIVLFKKKKELKNITQENNRLIQSQNELLKSLIGLENKDREVR